MNDISDMAETVEVENAKMNPEIKTQWLEALRSGQFHQARESFTEVTAEDNVELLQRHCCLAVLTELAVQAKVPGVRKVETDYGTEYEMARHSYDDEILFTAQDVAQAEAENRVEWGDTGGELPEQVRRWAGLDGTNPHIGPEQAIMLNDERKLTFAEIAHEIEKHL